MNHEDAVPKVAASLSRPISRNKSQVSDRKSLRSMDRLYLTDDSGQVFSEKCLINQKNYLRFKGNLRSLKSLFSEQKRVKKSGGLNHSCDRVGVGRGSRPGSKSGFHSSTHLDISDKATPGKTPTLSQNR